MMAFSAFGRVVQVPELHTLVTANNDESVGLVGSESIVAVGSGA